MSNYHEDAVRAAEQRKKEDEQIEKDKEKFKPGKKRVWKDSSDLFLGGLIGRGAARHIRESDNRRKYLIRRRENELKKIKEREEYRLTPPPDCIDPEDHWIQHTRAREYYDHLTDEENCNTGHARHARKSDRKYVENNILHEEDFDPLEDLKKAAQFPDNRQYIFQRQLIAEIVAIARGIE